MKPEDPNVQAWLEPELEARLVASLLGEASAFEQAELDRLLTERPEIAVFQRRLQAVHGLVGDAVKQGPDDEWKLSKDKRTKVLETIRGTQGQSEKPSNVVAQKGSRHQWIGIAAAASVVIFAGAIATTSMMSDVDSSASPDMAMTRERTDYGLEVDSNPDAVDGFDISANDGLERAAGTTVASFGELALAEKYAYQAPATPSKPREGLPRNTSDVTLSVNGGEVNFEPEVVEFEGFVNYESSVATTTRQANTDDLDTLGDLEIPNTGGAIAYHDSEEESLGNLSNSLELLERESKQQARDQTRAKLLDQVAQKWEMPVPSTAPVDRLYARSTGDAKSNVDAIVAQTNEKELSELAGESLSESIAEKAPAQKQNLGRKSKLAKSNKKHSDSSDNSRFGISVEDGENEAPAIVTRSGRKSNVEVVRELIFPEEYDQPEVAQVGETPPSRPDEFFNVNSSAPEINVHGRPRIDHWGFKTNESVSKAEGEPSAPPHIRKLNIAGVDFTKDERIRGELLISPSEVAPGQAGSNAADLWGSSEETAQIPDNPTTADLGGYFHNLEEAPALDEIAEASRDFRTSEDRSEPPTTLSDADNDFGQIAGIHLNDSFGSELGDIQAAGAAISRQTDQPLTTLKSAPPVNLFDETAPKLWMETPTSTTEPNAQPSASSAPSLAQAQGQPDKLAYFAKQDRGWALSDGATTESPAWASQPGMIQAFTETDSDSLAESDKSHAPLRDGDGDDDFGMMSGINPIERSLADGEAVTDDESTDLGLVIAGPKVEELAKGIRSDSEPIVESNLDAITPAPKTPEEIALAQQSDKVEEARLRMLDLAERYRIIDLAAMQNRASQTGDPVTDTDTILMSSMQDTYSAESNIAQIKMQMEKLEGLEGEELIKNAAMLDINDASLQTLLPQYQKAALEKSKLMSGGLDQAHPDVQEIEQQLAKTSSMLEMAVEGARGTLKTKLDMANRALALAKDIEEGKKDTSMDERRKAAEYAEASKAYETEKRNLRRLEEDRLSEALVQEDPETRETILQQQIDKFASQEAQVTMLGELYDIPAVLKRQNETAGSDGLSATDFESKKDTTMDDRRKLAEYKEAEQELGFRRKLLEKAKRALEPAKQPDLNEKHAKQEPFSTFSLHVSDVAFKLAKAALLEQNKWPDVEKVRVEEFVNAFDYGDPAPTQAEKVSCQIEQAAHPFRQQRNVLRVAMRTAEMGRSSGTPLQITLLLDTSGSMERADRQESISRAMDVLTSQLMPTDTVTLIGFARQPRLIQDRLTGEALGNLPTFVKQTPSEGGTNLEEALLLGAEHARRQFVEAGQNRIVLLTDGAANLGDADAESLRDLVVGLRQEGIAFDACGVGAEGLNDTVLEALTRDGDGRYYLLNKPEDADAGFARQLAGAFRPAARNVKVQVRFNDRRVGNYRLLGFEKHRLKKQDFRNDKVDAAEMASSEAGVAVYEIEPLAQGNGEIGEVSVRFQDMTTGQMVERSWTIAHDANVPVLEKATPSLQLASTAAFLGEKLKKSPFGQTINLEELSQIQTNLRQCYSSDQRVASLIAMIEKAKEQ